MAFPKIGREAGYPLPKSVGQGRVDARNRGGDAMTDAELDDRLAKLSDEDLQEMLPLAWNNELAGRCAAHRMIERMAREILDLRAKLNDDLDDLNAALC